MQQSPRYCSTVKTFSSLTYFSCNLQVNASDVIILEGILVFHDQRVRDLMNMKIFVDTGVYTLAFSVPTLIVTKFL